jgi:hypothetical protein
MVFVEYFVRILKNLSIDHALVTGPICDKPVPWFSLKRRIGPAYGNLKPFGHLSDVHDERLFPAKVPAFCNVRLFKTLSGNRPSFTARSGENPVSSSSRHGAFERFDNMVESGNFIVKPDRLFYRFHVAAATGRHSLKRRLAIKGRRAQSILQKIKAKQRPASLNESL